MAWFQHTMQDASGSQSSEVNMNFASDGHACFESNSSTAMLLASSGGNGLNQHHNFSNSYVPAASNDMPSLGELSCTSSHDRRVSNDPLSYVTLQEQRCVLNWFVGWSPSQKHRFLRDLVSKAVPRKVCSLLEQVNALQVTDRPPNIFECQLRLWTQWFESWSDEERNTFLNSLEEKDSVFLAQFYNHVADTSGSD